jgi:hypothetical protein
MNSLVVDSAYVRTRLGYLTQTSDLASETEAWAPITGVSEPKQAWKYPATTSEFPLMFHTHHLTRLTLNSPSLLHA